MRFLTRSAAALALAALALAPAGGADEAPRAKKRLLVITESRGFTHNCVNRRGKDRCLVEQALTEMGKTTGDFEAVCSQDSRSAITAENLKNFDAVFFYTTGTLPLSATQKADLIGFIRSGKGFAGAHSATDTFYDWPEYGKLIGGYFNGHPWHQKIRVIVEDGKHPATRHLGQAFEVTDEIYQFRAPYDRGRLHVLMRMDTEKVDRTTIRINGKEVRGSDVLELKVENGVPTAVLNGKSVDVKDFRLDGPRGARTDRDNALAWTQQYGKGRVFYTALGHSDELWRDHKVYLPHLRGGLRYVLGLDDGDATPSARAKE
jgi:type 1 glutamine amidotransferase